MKKRLLGTLFMLAVIMTSLSITTFATEATVIAEDTTCESNIILTTDLVVNPGVTLTLEDGATISVSGTVTIV